MSRTAIRVVMAAMAVCFTAVTSTAQTTTTSSTQTKKFEVIAVDGNDLVVKLPEGTREINVPDDFRFTVDGQQLAGARPEGGHERHGDHHDEDDGDAGGRDRGEERRSHAVVGIDPPGPDRPGLQELHRR